MKGSGENIGSDPAVILPALAKNAPKAHHFRVRKWEEPP
jgi:hypothetical protein